MPGRTGKGKVCEISAFPILEAGPGLVYWRQIKEREKHGDISASLGHQKRTSWLAA